MYIIREVDTGSKFQVSESIDLVKLRERSQRVCLDEDREGESLSGTAQSNLRSINRSVLGNRSAWQIRQRADCRVFECYAEQAGDQ